VSLLIQRIAVDCFRKFREPIAIEGLTAGLNIVIEPNEMGKSTLLEALRAAFFVRHNTKNQLAQSFAPHGEAVGPQIEVGFTADGAPWSVTKRFLKNPSIEVVGPQGRAQGEEAEARLNALLGSVRDTSRAGDASAYGALGLLWVAQTEALSVTPPGQIVRDTIQSTLETEVGSIMGGPAYKRVRDRLETHYEAYWTPTGQRRGRQSEARERLEVAEAAARDAAERQATLERNFNELDATRARLKVIQREMADDTDIQTRKDLATSLELARAAAQILATRRAEQEAASGKLNGLLDLQQRHREATTAHGTADTALTAARARRTGLADTLTSAKKKATDTRSALDAARAARKAARTALSDGEASVAGARRGAAIAAARKRHKELLELERQYREAKALSATAIAVKLIASLESNERAVATARATLNAGATRITLVGSAAGVTLDGAPMLIGERTLTHEARIRLGEAELIVSPPTSAASAEETLASALQKQRDALQELGVNDLAGARARNDFARDAAAELRTLEARIAAATPADAAVDLAAGADALKLFVTGLTDDEESVQGETLDLSALVKAMEDADTALARAEGAHDSAIEALQSVEAEDAPLAAAEGGAASDMAHASALIEAIEKRAEWASLAADLAQARTRAAEASVKLEDAIRDASAHDPAAITRKIDIIDARARTTAETRTKLETDIARFEGTIESEGGKGLADREAAAREEAEAARAALQRVTEEADTLKLLRETLDDARNETSAKFVGPVARRAKRYIERLLPECELRFSEDLALESVTRAGVDENCANLSRGTQEQLAILTRVAFADMLLEQGRPVSLILDDPLVYSDDARLDLMIEILAEAAQRMQIILLTCRDRAFRHVAGNRISLIPAC
jgi:uncharacterized protein YhaN